jgi:hypothetical protein
MREAPTCDEAESDIKKPSIAGRLGAKSEACRLSPSRPAIEGFLEQQAITTKNQPQLTPDDL